MDNETNSKEQELEKEFGVVEVEIGKYQKVRRKHHSSKKSSSSGSSAKGENDSGGESGHHSHHSSKHHSHHSSHKKHRKKSPKKIVKRILISVGCIILALVIFVIGTFFYLRTTGKNEFAGSSYTITAPKEVKTKNDGYTVFYNGKTYEYKKDAVNILFMGIDDYSESWTGSQAGVQNQADVLILISIDLSENKMTLVNIPRDIITDVAVYSKTGGYTGIEKLPISMSYAYGDGAETSCINTLDSVRKLFYNIQVNSYFSLEKDGIGEINDSVGGIDVTSPEDVYRQSVELVFEEGKDYHLEGDEARDFVMLRSHETPEANLLRNERQRIYLSEFIKKVISQTKSDLSTPIKLYNTAEEYSCTNITLNRVTYLASELLGKGSPKTEMKTVPVDVKQVEDHAENYLRESEFYELFLSVFYKEKE